MAHSLFIRLLLAIDFRIVATFAIISFGHSAFVLGVVAVVSLSLALCFLSAVCFCSYQGHYIIDLVGLVSIFQVQEIMAKVMPGGEAQQQQWAAHGDDRRRRHDDAGSDDEEEEDGLVVEERRRPAPPPPPPPPAAPRPSRSLASSSLNEGVYIPPARRKAMEQEALQQNQQQQDSSIVQRQTWQEQRRVVHGTVNRSNASTIKPLIHDLFQKVNLIRMRGVLAKSLLQAAVSSPKYANVYAALVAVLNTKLPEVGELVVKRSILGFRRYYRQKDKASCLSMAIFLGHLFHQAVVHELLVLQILTLLLDGDPTDDSVEVAVEFLTTVGYALLEVSPAGVRAVLERLRALLHEGNLNSRVEYKMEQLLALRKTGFRDHPPIPEELDLVERDDQITFELGLDDDDIKKEDYLDVFRVDDEYDEHEKTWSKIRAEILGLDDDDDDDDDGSDGESETDDSKGGGSNESDDDEEGADVPDQELAVIPAAKAGPIQDLSESDLVHLRRQIYLTIMSSATFEECTHKLAKIHIPVGREEELINMIIECCSQERTFLRYYGLIAGRFCVLDDRWKDAFLTAFKAQYTTIHRLETNKLRNVAKLFAHLLHTDSMPWSCLSIVHLNEDETTSSSRIFVKILMQEMAEAIGMAKLKSRLESDDPEQKEWYKGMFPRDNVRNTRYAINFFTSIGLGPLTDGLREFLKNAPKMIMAQGAAETALVKKDSDESSVSSTSSSSSSSVSSSSSSASSSYTSSSYSSYSSDSRRRSRSRRRRSRSSSSYTSSSSSGSYSSYSSRFRPRARPRERSRSYSSSDESRSRSPTPEGRKMKSNRSRSGSYDRDQPKDREGKSSSSHVDTRERGDRKRRYRSASPPPSPGRGRVRNDKEPKRKRSKRDRPPSGSR
jgi:pre-mRNA-splicing factor CWC22